MSGGSNLHPGLKTLFLASSLRAADASPLSSHPLLQRVTSFSCGFPSTALEVPAALLIGVVLILRSARR